MCVRNADTGCRTDAQRKEKNQVYDQCATIAERLRKDCSRDHQRIRLEGGSRTRQSEVYPEKLCAEIIRGLRDQMKVDGMMTDEGTGTACAVDEWRPDEEND